MNTERSNALVAEYLGNGGSTSRRIQTYTRTFNVPVDMVFHQLCPAREYDWIPGLECELIHTSTGFVEADCVFRTPETNSLGPGLWIFTRYELNRCVELVRIIGSSVVIHLRIHLTDNGDGKATGTWHVTTTALDPAGDVLVNAMPDESPEFLLAIDGLEHFLKTGELLAVQ